MPPEIDYEQCTGCGECVEACAEDVFFGSQPKGQPVVTYPEACFHCYLCAQACPLDAVYIRTSLIMHVPYR